MRGWVSPDYGQRLPAPMLIYACNTSLPWRAVTVLLPARGCSSAPPSLRVIHDEAGLPGRLVFEDPRESVLIDERFVCLDRDREFRR